MKQTVLYDRHVALGAKMVEFAGWNMPVQYGGMLEEHKAVREATGIFDVSHMGRVEVSGPEAEAFVDYISTNRQTGKKDLSATYTVLTNEDGGAVDDSIIYRIDAQHFYLIVNAGNRDKDLSHLQRQAEKFDVRIKDYYQEEGILAIQGPKAPAMVEEFFPEGKDIKFMNFAFLEHDNQKFILSKTGYTGSPGYEIYAPNDLIADFWDRFVEKGAVPIGLGARDSLRLEMGFALYGHELADDISPFESVSSWTVKLKNRCFLGSEAVAEMKTSPKRRRQYGVKLKGRGIPRQGFEVYQGNRKIGTVTSGGHSPCLNMSIAIVMVDCVLETGQEIDIQIRKNRVSAEVCALPFYDPSRKMAEA